MIRLLTALLLLMSLLPSSLAEDSPAYYEAPHQIVVSFTGDCTLGCTDSQRLDTKKGFEAVIQREGMAYPFAMVKEIFDADDLTVVNLESVFYEHDANKADKKYNFRAPCSYVDILRQGGVDAVSFANNHVLDYGIYGFQSTIDTLDAAGIPWFGVSSNESRTYIFEKDGIRLGFVSAYIGEYWGNREKTQQCFQGLKDAGCSAIVGILHGGVEYDVLHDTGYVESMANSFIRYGADVVVGHHPHTLQGMRVENGRTTLWSLGNFVFGGNPEIRQNHAGESVIGTAIAQFTFSFDEEGAYLGHQLNLIPCHISGHTNYNDYQPYPVEGSQAAAVLRSIQRDTQPRSLKLSPYVEGAGALQPFVPAPSDR